MQTAKYMFCYPQSILCIICNLTLCMDVICSSSKEGMNKGGKGGSARAYDTVPIKILEDQI